MKLGAALFQTDLGMHPLEFAREAEARGFDSAWFTEHSHIPVSRRTPWSGIKGSPPLPKFYAHMYDQFVTLGAVAAVTSKIKLGTGIALVAQRDPIWLAKEVATVDCFSNGRLILGVGSGWNHEEMQDHGLNPKGRGKVLREKILACKELWTKEEASFDGEFVKFERSWAWPKPVQTPHPPIAVGYRPSENNFRHIVEWGDLWLPGYGRQDPEVALAGIKDAWPKLLIACEKAGRDPATLGLGVFQVLPDARHIEELGAHGAQFSVVMLPGDDRDGALRIMDKCAPLIERFNQP
jgi:probable F420-dependent oxidoreductase